MRSKQSKPWHHAKASRHERGYGSAWVKLRELILSRDMCLCQACLTKGRPTPAEQVDHIKPKSKGGTDDPDNLQSLCAPCHDAKTAIDMYGERRIIGADGWPIE